MGLFKKKEKEVYVPKQGLMGNALDYSVYKMSVIERLMYFFIGALVGYLLGWVFYENLFMSIVLGIVVGFVLIPIRRKQIIEKRKDRLLMQFRDMLESLSTSLGAGANIQDAFRSAQKDMSVQYEEGSLISKELDVIVNGMSNNLNIEELLMDFGERSQVEDVVQFANVFEVCYRRGGNIKEVIKNTHTIICDKVEIQMEIKTVVASKKMEQNAMMVMPVLFISLLKGLGSEVIDITSSVGRISTTVGVAMFVVAYLVSKKILAIKV